MLLCHVVYSTTVSARCVALLPFKILTYGLMDSKLYIKCNIQNLAGSNKSSRNFHLQLYNSSSVIQFYTYYTHHHVEDM